MANFRKSFNFRNGVQVDDDNFVVNPNGLVGIGTSIPSEFLDVRGTAKFVGLTTVKNAFFVEGVYVAGVATFKQDFEVGITSIQSNGIVTATTPSGIVTYYGDGGQLLNLPTSQWVDVDPGFGYTSIYAAGYVGIATTMPYNALQIGGNSEFGQDGVGINSTGDINATGIITTRQLRLAGSGAAIVGVTSILASTTDPLFRVIQLGSGDAFRVDDDTPDSTPFVINSTGRAFIGTTGDSSGLAGLTFYNSYARFISTITGNAAGDGLLIGEGPLDAGYQQIHTYDRPLKIESEGTNNHLLMIPSADSNIGLGTTNPTSKVSVLGNVFVTGVTTVTELKASISTTGISTVTEYLHVGSGGTVFSALEGALVGIGSAIPTAELQIRKPTAVNVEVISESQTATISYGQENGSGAKTGFMRYGAAAKTVDIGNNDTGDLNFVIHGGPAGLNTGNFAFVYGQTNGAVATLTYTGDLGLGESAPQHKLHVVGTSTVTGKTFLGSDLEVVGNVSAGSYTFPAVIDNVRLNTTSGISTMYDIELQNNITVANRLGIATDTAQVELDCAAGRATFSTIGIATDLEYLVPASGSLVVGGDANFSQSIGIGTTAHTYRVNLGWPEVCVVYGGLGVIDNRLAVHNGQLAADPNTPFSVGILTALCAVDLSAAGSGNAIQNANFMRLPHCTSGERVGLVTQSGAVIYNSTNQDYQAYSNNQWVSLKAGNAGVVESISAAGAASVTGVTELTATADYTVTLANGTVGDTKIFALISDNSPPTRTVTITPATFLGGTSIELDAVGESVTLLYTSSGWVVVGGNAYTIV